MTELPLQQRTRTQPLLHEALRKSIHVSVSVIAALLIWFLPPNISHVIFPAVALIAVSIDLARLYVPSMRGVFTRLLGPLLRSRETKRMTGATTLAIGIALCVLMFPRNFAMTGILYAGLADAGAALIGRRFGRHRFASGRSVEGSVTFAAIALVIGLVVPGIGIFAAATGALVATIVEAAPLKFDDNLVLPVTGSLITYLASRFVH